MPLSLPSEMRARTFVAGNGELGIDLLDVETFLNACQTDAAAVLGWEVWVVDHVLDATNEPPMPAKGQWCGLIPVKAHASSAVIGGSVIGERKGAESWAEFVLRSVSTARDQIADFKPDEEVPSEWLPFIRVNFTFELEGER